MRRLALALPALVALGFTATILPSCTTGGGIVESADAAAPETFEFPKGFLFGTAIAGFQADMGCPSNLPGCIDPNSDWYQWVTTPAIISDPAAHVKGEPVTNGPGFYELYPQDLDRAKNELRSGALRLSIEWSRIFPTSTEGIEDEAALKAAASPENLAWYHQVFAAMKARGLVPLVTLNHYSLPTWIHDAAACHADLDGCTARGWLDHDRIVHEIAKYAGFVAREFGGEVDLWATLNEPFTAVVVAGFLLPSATRSNPPGVMLRIPEAKQAALAMIDAHARMYDAVKANDKVAADPARPAASVGLVYNLEAVAPSDPEEPVDVEGAKNLSYLLNDVFLNACVFGDLDANLDGKTVRRDDLANRMDYIGINYYARLIAKGAASPFPALSPLLTVSISSLTNQDYDYPRGVYEVLMHARKWKVPLYITETGYQDALDDGRAAAWLVRTLAYAKRAYTDGAPIGGFFWWTLMDNYEWNHGMAFHMGMYGVDPKDPSKARKPRKGAPMYGRIAGTGTIPKDLLELYPSAR